MGGAQPDPPTETINVTEARHGWSGLLNRVFRRESRVVIERSGIPVAAIAPYWEYEFFLHMKAKRDERFKALEAFAEPLRDAPPGEIEREVAKAIAEVRAENRERERLAGEQVVREETAVTS